MIPRIHKRGSSFKTAAQYVLHDPLHQQSHLDQDQLRQQPQTADRVSWADCLNLDGVAPADAWRAMYDTWGHRTALKRASGEDLRGRDNKAPVLHYTLAWHPDERPTEAQMKEAALSSLKALKLDEHQVLMAAHNDKDHAHVHLIVNTVHPKTGRTAPMKFSRLELSKWAQEYEKQHGIHLQQRIDNNAERARRKDERQRKQPARKQPRERRELPVNLRVNKIIRDRTTRPDHIIREDVIDRMKRLRTEIRHRHHVERDVTSSVQRGERQDLERNSKEAASIALAHVQQKFSGPWRELFKAQRNEVRQLEAIQGNPLERAAYVFMNADRLSGSRNLTMKEKARLVQSPTALFKAVDQMHTRERRLLSNVQRVETKARLDRVWQVHQHRDGAMVARHDAEQQAQRAHQYASTSHVVDFADSKAQLVQEKIGAIPPRRAANAPAFENDVGYVRRINAELQAFEDRNTPKDEPMAERPARPEFVPVPREHGPTSRAATIKLDIAEWKSRRRGKDDDFEHEM